MRKTNASSSIRTSSIRLSRRTLLAAATLSAMPGVHAQGTAATPDAAAFFRSPQMAGAVLSPDGRRVALLTVAAHGRVVLSVLDFATMAPVLVYGSDVADVNRAVWVNPQRLAFDLADRDTPQGKLDSAPGLFAVDADGQGFRQLVERQRVFVKTGDDFTKLLPWNTFLRTGGVTGNDDAILVERPEAYSSKDVDYIKLLRLNTRTGRTEEVDAPLHAVDWWLDAKGELRVVQTRDGRQGAVRWKDPQSGDWRLLSEYEVYTGDGDLRVRGIAPDGSLYVNARRGGDRLATWLLNPLTREWSARPLAQSPQFDVDARLIARRDKVLGLRFTVDAEVTQWLDADMKALQAQIDQLLPATVNRLSVAQTGDSPWVLIESFADIQPRLFYAFNRETRKVVRLGAERPDIAPGTMAPMDLHRIKARDGRELPLWLSLPRQGAKKLPMVVLVHGGPFTRGPDWRWDAEVQFLNARGYAVLQAQFRGTLGFGEAHHRAGWKQWGKAMQTDLADATAWAIEQGIADPQRIAIAGASYGGYAALMGLVRDPGLFRCGVAWVGVTDLDMLHTVSWDDISPDYKTHGMPVLLGDRVKEAADLKEHSPLTHAAKITQPLLLAYGEKDRRVPLIHGQTFRRAVQATNTQVEWIEYADEGHGWRLPANQIDFWNRTARFLDQYLAPKT